MQQETCKAAATGGANIAKRLLIDERAHAIGTYHVNASGPVEQYRD